MDEFYECYALPSQKKNKNYSIVDLEMINTLVTLKIWTYQWKDKKIQVKCDNMAVVKVHTSGKTKDATLGASKSWELISTYVPNVSWVPTDIDLTCLNYDV